MTPAPSSSFAEIYQAARRNVAEWREGIAQVQDQTSPASLASRHRIERALVGTALANPTDLVVAKILRDIPSYSFRSLAHQAIWQACLETSYLPPLPPTQRGILLERVVHQIWVACKSPSSLPRTATYAMVLSDLFPSPAPIAALARQFLDLRDETNLRRQILQSAALYRAGEISTSVFLSRMSALRDPGLPDFAYAVYSPSRIRAIRGLRDLDRSHGA